MLSSFTNEKKPRGTQHHVTGTIAAGVDSDMLFEMLKTWFTGHENLGPHVKGLKEFIFVIEREKVKMQLHFEVNKQISSVKNWLLGKKKFPTLPEKNKMLTDATVELNGSHTSVGLLAKCRWKEYKGCVGARWIECEKVKHMRKGEEETAIKPDDVMELQNENKIEVPDNVREVYYIVNAKTCGELGGNGGPYMSTFGENTIFSVQRVVNEMKKVTGFDRNSRFIDVGSGLGKPNLHVAQDPGVEFNYGVEESEDRRLLSINNLKNVLIEAETNKTIGYNCFLDCNDITNAQSFDPFTHVYMFDKVFVSDLHHNLSAMFNRSSAMYLISYLPPKRIVDEFKYDVKRETLSTVKTKMVSSGEISTAYFYERNDRKEKKEVVVCDPLFEEAYKQRAWTLKERLEYVEDEIKKHETSRRKIRSKHNFENIFLTVIERATGQKVESLEKFEKDFQLKENMYGRIKPQAFAVKCFCLNCVLKKIFLSCTNI